MKYRIAAFAGAAVLSMSLNAAAQEMTLKASHQFPG